MPGVREIPYDAVILATGSDRDAPFDIPGVDLDGVYGASQFVYWYDGHPDVPRDWPLDAERIAVLGAELAASGRPASGLGFSAQSGLPVSRVMV